MSCATGVASSRRKRALLKGWLGTAVARAEWDAPEVDLFARIEAEGLSAGDIVQVEAVGLDDHCNHVCELVEG